MNLKQGWDSFKAAIRLATGRPRVITGTILDDTAERARLLRLPRGEQVAILEQALQAAPEYRAQLAEASAAWDTWKQHFVVKQMRQALGPATTKEEIQTLIDVYRRLPSA
jgi:hypothetical protein